jgi:ArsR family transcriptional regulator
MPSEFEPEEAAAGVRVTPSPALEFQFSLFLFIKHCLDPEKWVPDWVVDASSANSALIADLLDFWVGPGLAELDGSPYREWGELLAAGWHTGTLFAPVDRFLEAVEPALAGGFAVPVLESEPPAARDLIQRRVDWLAGHPEGLEHLMRMMHSAWDVVRPYWEPSGRIAADAAARDLVAKVRPGVDLRTLVPGNNFLHKEAFQAHILAARTRNELVIVPLGLAGGGQFYWSFPGLVLVGAGVDSAEREAKRRARAERAANKLKVLSDPTRVAILYELLKARDHNPATVTELASHFGLSQPTVSVHVKILREAGLVRSDRDGNQVFYHAEEETIRRYVGDALDDVLQKAEGGMAEITQAPVSAR